MMGFKAYALEKAKARGICVSKQWWDLKKLGLFIADSWRKVLVNNDGI